MLTTILPHLDHFLPVVHHAVDRIAVGFSTDALAQFSGPGPFGGQAGFFGLFWRFFG